MDDFVAEARRTRIRQRMASILLRHREATFEEAEAACLRWEAGGPYLTIRELSRDELADHIWKQYVAERS